MKKVLFRSVLLLLALTAMFVLIAPPAKNAQAAKGVSQFCKEFADDLPGCFKNQGECVSIVQAIVNAEQGHGNTDGVAICKLIQNGFNGSSCSGAQDFPLGACVSFFAQGGCL